MLTSRPKVRAPLVNARGRLLGFAASSSFGRASVNTGLARVGDTSMRSLFGVWIVETCGGEWSDMVEANDNSRSDDKNSSTSSRGRWNRLREGAAGGADKNWSLGANRDILSKSN